MVLKMRERVICCIVATILFFVGISAEMPATDSAILCAVESARIYSVDHIVLETGLCPLTMLTKNTSTIQRNLTNSMSRWQDRTGLLYLFVGVGLQYLLYYQSSECKEDGQLLLSRAVAVNYIHQKDGGE